jgi:PKD repeat protein
MDTRVVWGLLLLFGIAPSAVAGPPREGDTAPGRRPALGSRSADLWCATGRADEREPPRLRELTAARAGVQASIASTTTRVDKGVYFMTADDGIAPFDKPFDLHNSSLVFTRMSPTAFSVQKTSLTYDADIGSLAMTTTGWPPYKTMAYRINAFAFPFYDRSVRDLVVSSAKGIFLSTPPASNLYQFGMVEALAQRVPVIAPLLNTTRQPVGALDGGSNYQVYIKETTGALTVTWRRVPSAPAAEDIQVVLFANGDIRFAYRTVVNVSHGAVMVTSGVEAWYDDLPAGLFRTDPSGDVNAGTPSKLRDMLDIESVDVRRVSHSDYVEIVATTRAPIDPTVLLSGEAFELNFGQTGIRVTASAISIYTVGWYSVSESPAITIAGRSLVIRAPAEALRSLGDSFWVSSYYDLGTVYGYADHANDGPGLASFPPAQQSAQTDLSQLSAPAVIDNKPIVETFTVPRIDIYAVWDKLKAEYGLSDVEIDQVAVYWSFMSDIIFWAGARSQNSNPQVDNIAPGRYGYGSAYPKRASLLEMNAIGYGWNETDAGRMHVLSHEFGHRWLYFLSIREGTEDTFNLNPDRVHPKAVAHVPAAYNVVTATDSSTMGGGYFTQTGDRTYTTPSSYSAYGYSWHELYLMGLAAAPEATQPWFYLDGPGLSYSGTAPTNWTFTVDSRTDVQFSQITDSLGFRSPSFATSQKSFTMPFVVLERSTERVSSQAATDFAAAYPKRFREYFAAATGNRGSVKISPASMPPEANFTFSPSEPLPGQPVTFIDHSYGEPESWEWSFGDSATSTARNPTHTFTLGGAYNVTLTVSKPSGAHSTSYTIIVAPSNLQATATSAASVSVTWSSNSTANTFEVVRAGRDNAGREEEIVLARNIYAGYVDDSAVPGTAYVYKVRQTGIKSREITPSAFSSDLATTVMFTDPTLNAGGTVLKAAHVTELRTAVNAVRALAGLSAFVATETLIPGSTIAKSVHLTGLRTALGEARGILALPSLSFANSCAAGTPIRAADVEELRDGVK